MADVAEIHPHRRRALKGWARRRLTAYLKAHETYTGQAPESVTIWAEDFDLLGGHDDRVELRRGSPRL